MTVDEYLDAAPEPQQSTLRAVRSILLRLVPDGVDGMSYGVPAVKQGATAVVGYASFTKHCGLYPHSEAVLPQVAAELIEGYDWERGTLRFPIDQPPSDALVARIVELRLAELER